MAYSPDELLGPLNDVERRNAPKHLFLSGDRGLLARGARVSIVGARRATALGVTRAERLAAKLARRGVVVVSGLAEGIDTAAHVGAMREGFTIAVLGTPLDVCYPARNRALQERIAAEHLALSQFPPGFPVTPATKSRFVQRNRTMALLSDATVIVEAGETSGSLSQGWEALRLGRDLFIAESVADDRSLKWPGEMRRYGAEVLTARNFDAFVEALPTRAYPTEAAVAF